MTEIDSKKMKKVIERIKLLFVRSEYAVQDAKNPNEVDHEAQAALELARKLMLQYGLGMEDVEVEGASKLSGGPEAGGSVVEMQSRQATSKWILSLAIVVADYMDASVLYIEPSLSAGGKLFFYGVELNAKMAAYAFQSVFNQVKVLSRKYKVNRREYEGAEMCGGLMRNLMGSIARHTYSTFDAYRNAAKREYREGLISGFAMKLQELKRQEQFTKQGEQITALAIRHKGVAKDWLQNQGFEPPREKKLRSANKHTGFEHYGKGQRDAKNVQVRKGIEN